MKVETNTYHVHVYQVTFQGMLFSGETKDVFSHEDAVYGLSPDPTNPSVFATACDDGRVLIYDTRDSCGGETVGCLSL